MIQKSNNTMYKHINVVNINLTLYICAQIMRYPSNHKDSNTTGDTTFHHSYHGIRAVGWGLKLHTWLGKTTAAWELLCRNRILVQAKDRSHWYVSTRSQSTGLFERTLLTVTGSANAIAVQVQSAIF